MDVRLYSVGAISFIKISFSAFYLQGISDFFGRYRTSPQVPFAPHPNPPPRRGEGRVGVMSSMFFIITFRFTDRLMYGREMSCLTGKSRNPRPLPHGMIQGVERSLIFKADQDQRDFFRDGDGISGLGEGRLSSNRGKKT